MVRLSDLGLGTKNLEDSALLMYNALSSSILSEKSVDFSSSTSHSGITILFALVTSVTFVTPKPMG